MKKSVPIHINGMGMQNFHLPLRFVTNDKKNDWLWKMHCIIIISFFIIQDEKESVKSYI